MSVSGTELNSSAYNPVQHVFKIASTGTEGVLETAGEMTQGGINFLGKTTSDIFNEAGRISNNLNNMYNVPAQSSLDTSIYNNGNIESNLSSVSSDSLGSGLGGSNGQSNLATNGFDSLGNLLRGTLRGIGGLSQMLGASTMELGYVLSLASLMQAPTNAMRMAFIAPYPSYYGFYPPCTVFDPMPVYDTYNPYMSYNPYMTYNTYDPYNSYNQYLSMPYGNSITMGDVDRLLHPEHYNNNGNTNNNNVDQKPKTEESTDNKSLPVDDEPNWYRDLVVKTENKQSLTKNEKDLKAAHEKLMRTYSPWNKDSNGDPIPGQVGPLGDKIMQLQRILASKNRDAMEQLLRTMSADELAAIEAHYPIITQGRNLRADIKECCLVYGLGWTGYNTDRCEHIMNRLDEAAMVHPRAMANALNQAINNHRMMGFGIDDDRVAKLMKMMKGNKEFLRAVEYEYSHTFQRELRNDLDSKWFISDENKDVINSTLGSF